MRVLCITPQFTKDFSKVPLHIKVKADNITVILKENPVDGTLRTKKLTGIKPPVWRVRIGAYRIVYSFNKTTITFLRICHRKDIYHNL